MAVLLRSPRPAPGASFVRPERQSASIKESRRCRCGPPFRRACSCSTGPSTLRFAQRFRPEPVLIRRVVMPERSTLVSSTFSGASECHVQLSASVHALRLLARPRQVIVGDNEPTDSALRRFRKSVLQAGILPEVGGFEVALRRRPVERAELSSAEVPTARCTGILRLRADPRARFGASRRASTSLREGASDVQRAPAVRGSQHAQRAHVPRVGGE